MKILKQTQEKGQLIIALFQISSRLLQLCILYRKEKIVVKFNPSMIFVTDANPTKILEE